jgi:DNA-directed RNA polymerase specialized sigma24 family protein
MKLSPIKTQQELSALLSTYHNTILSLAVLYHRNDDFEDTLQNAILGAIKAFHTYDSDRGLIIPYLSSCIKEECNKRDNDVITSIPKDSIVVEHDNIADYLPDNIDLSERQLLKYKILGYTRNEISSMMNIPITILNIKIQNLYEKITNANKD